MASVADFQKMLLTDANARKEFAKSPSAFLAKHMVALPPGTKLPASIPENDLESAVSTVHSHLGGTDVSRLGNDPAAVSDLVRNAFPAKATPAHLNNIKNTMAKRTSDVQNAQTIAVVGAVVVAVVAVPAAVYGASERE